MLDKKYRESYKNKYKKYKTKYLNLSNIHKFGSKYDNSKEKISKKRLNCEQNSILYGGNNDDKIIAIFDMEFLHWKPGPLVPLDNLTSTIQNVIQNNSWIIQTDLRYNHKLSNSAPMSVTNQ